MSLPEYLWAESPGTAQRLVSNAISSRFNDGYEQAAPGGLNPVSEVWDVVHSKTARAVAAEIKAFLKDGFGWKRFTWTPPGQTELLVWKCTSYQESMTDQVDEVNISATFEQVFQP